MDSQTSVFDNPLKLIERFSKSGDFVKIVGFATEDNLKLFIDCYPLEKTETGETIQRPFPKDEENWVKHLDAIYRELLHLLSDIPPNLIHENVLKDVLKHIAQGHAIERRRIAKGIEPIKGRDGKLVLLVRPRNALHSHLKHEIESGEHPTTGSFDNIEQDMPVARIYPPTAGTDGFDVFGKKISAIGGADYNLSFDDQALVIKDAEMMDASYSVAFAIKEGYLSTDNGKLTIIDTLDIDSDVGLKTGDIDFVGSVNIDGDVLKGFFVHAKQNVAVSGNAIGCSIKSKLGSISIQGAAYGSSIKEMTNTSTNDLEKKLTKEAEFSSHSKFSALLAQGITVSANDDIVIENEASHSNLYTRGAIIIPNGVIYGCECRVVQGVEVQYLGTPSGAENTIYLCSDVESSYEYAYLVYRIKQHESALELLALQLGPFATDLKRLDKLEPSYKEKLKNLLLKHKNISASLEKLQTEKTELLTNTVAPPFIRVNIKGMFYPGGKLIAEDVVFAPTSEIEGPVTIEWKAETKTFETGAIKPLVEK